MIDTLLNQRYLLQSEIGRGGMGIVYRAHDTLLEREVAVKLVSTANLVPEGQARLLQEARAAASLNHPHIAAIYDAGEAQTDPGVDRAAYIVMELVEGPSLRVYQPASLGDSLAVAWQICSALEAAHAKGIIHRDLKPENVLVTGRPASRPDGDKATPPVVKLMDFGLARVTGASYQTQEGTVIGTLSYLAPELILGQPASPQSDLYAMGVLLYELVAGRPPFEGDNVAALLSSHLHAPVVPPSAYNKAVWPELDVLVLQLLEKEPGLRPSSAGEVRERLALLQVEAAPETEALLAAIRSGALGAAPPLRSAGPPHNLPVQLTSFVGRQEQLARLKALLATNQPGGNRLVTLTGSGGIGKTRLAIQAAQELLPEYSDGVWLVELAPLFDPAFVPKAVATVLNVPEKQERPLSTTLANFLREKTLLLVLDNCEHVIETCSQLADYLLHNCPNLRILASSREALGVEGENTIHVPSLSLPSTEHAGPSTPADSEAVQLFVERVSAVLPGFALTDANALAIVRVCRLLDGIPLAIELAAARVRTLRVEQIASRLDDALRLLTGGRRTALPRQQTLRATIDWSYNLLSDSERILLRWLSVFAGGWTLEAAESVCPGEDLHTYDVLDGLTQLVSKSLVVADRQQGQETRYHLLETTRQYAREKLLESGEVETVRDHHLAFYLSLAEEIDLKRKSAERLACMKQFDTENDNFRAALEWALAETNVVRAELGLRLASALKQFWHRRGHSREGRGWLEQGLALVGTGNPESTAIRARALYAAGYLALFHDDVPSVPTQLLEESVTLYRKIDPSDKRDIVDALNLLASLYYGYLNDPITARALSEESVAICRGLGSSGKWDLAQALFWNGHLAFLQEDDAAAHACVEESQSLFRQTGDVWEAAAPISTLGHLAVRQGDFSTARNCYEESLRLWREGGDVWGIAASTGWLGHIDRIFGDYAAASVRFEESLRLWRDWGNRADIALTLRYLGFVALFQGNYERAAALLSESLPLLQGSTDDFEVALNLAGMSGVARAQGQGARAARLLGAADAFVVSTDSWGIKAVADLAEYDRLRAAGLAQAHEAAFAAAWAEGRAMSIEEATAYALRK